LFRYSPGINEEPIGSQSSLKDGGLEHLKTQTAMMFASAMLGRPGQRRE
jgi:hypothetical protein